MTDIEKLSFILDAAIDRAKLGRCRYGEFDPETDYRDLFKEAEEELLDGIVYLAFQAIKINEIRAKFYKKSGI